MVELTVVHFGYFQINKRREGIAIILYLTSNINLGLFDFLEKENSIPMKKLVGQFSLERFTKFDIRSLSYNNYLIIDISAIEENMDKIIENLIAINTLYDMRIILLADEVDPDDLKRLVDKTKIYNIITETTVEKIKKEMLLCISPNGMTREYINAKISSDYGFDFEVDTYTFEKQVKIALVGSMERIGTTTTSINIASYLESIGGKVSYTEANNSNHLKDIHNIFFKDNIVKENHFTANGIDYFFNFNIPSTNYDFNIIDLGVLTDANINIFNAIEGVKILCGGVKPYEIPSLSDSIERLKDIKQYHILLPKGDMINISNYIPDYENNMFHRIEYSKSLFNGDKNKKTWELLLSEYIIKHKSLEI